MAKKAATKAAKKTTSAKKATPSKGSNSDLHIARPVIEDAFPDRNEDLESATLKLIQAEAAIETANQKKKSAYEALKELMLDLEIEVYKCYTVPKKVVCKPEAAAVKLLKIGAKEESPYNASE